jgi:hypothetical protein
MVLKLVEWKIFVVELQIMDEEFSKTLSNWTKYDYIGELLIGYSGVKTL